MQANESKPNQSNTVQSNHKPAVAIQTNSAIPFRSDQNWEFGRLGDWGWYIYSLGNARQLGNQRKLELPMVAAMWLQFH